MWYWRRAAMWYWRRAAMWYLRRLQYLIVSFPGDRYIGFLTKVDHVLPVVPSASYHKYPLLDLHHT